jgi:hypothetical protein
MIVENHRRLSEEFKEDSAGKAVGLVDILRNP